MVPIQLCFAFSRGSLKTLDFPIKPITKTTNCQVMSVAIFNKTAICAIFVPQTETKVPTASNNLNSLTQLGKTPVKLENMLEYLQIYPNLADAKLIYDGFLTGFKINYSGPRIASNCNNLVSAKQHESELEEKINKEIIAGRIAGPFIERPFENLRLSPIGLVPKKEGGWRMIQHLSYPHGESVNSFIDPDLSTVQYTSFDKVLATISAIGKGAILARMDIKSAFRLLPLDPKDFPLFGFKFKSMFYFDKNLVMGLSAACALWEKYASFVMSAENKQSNTIWMIIFWLAMQDQTSALNLWKFSEKSVFILGFQ